ncbi:thioredoxin-like isoform X2 [Sinocyclocheilus rhinocerous]|uniref:thioredoxin-like isoform X2 n=1 Tax=Sinocyclocheilus rhinocerous TaxID=307959 RepID=UPI0007BA085D|nr:PREDICTED: thioredoxin-like isoform X2 [Sinocyclocheilus rhinocerous]
MIIVIEDQDGFDKALAEAGDKLVVVDFTATWCGPCQSIAPFYKDVAQSCDIKCMPTFHFYKSGKKLEDFSGSNKTKLEEIVNQHKG